MARTLTHREAKSFYDWLGRGQDRQAVYERPAVDELLAHGRFEAARAVCEFGCGTGALAQHLMIRRLPEDATYLALDVSETMTALARERLRAWAARALVVRIDGRPAIPAPAGVFDRVLATYVLDLLSGGDIAALLAEAHRVLVPGGLLCLAGLTRGDTAPARVVTALWAVVHAWRPRWVGGCRPIDLRAHLPAEGWTVEHRAVVTRLAVSSEVLVAARR